MLDAEPRWSEVGMADRNGDATHRTAREQPVGKPFSSGYDARRNPGGRPRGLAAAVRAAVGEDGHDLIEFFSAIVRDDRKTLGLRHPVALRERMQAAVWLSDRGCKR